MNRLGWEHPAVSVYQHLCSQSSTMHWHLRNYDFANEAERNQYQEVSVIVAKAVMGIQTVLERFMDEKHPGWDRKSV